ncbi:unnamed protein product [Gemmata massiliana]|uniref:Uncharacterized protein n=1 Tax=Gemmata massiliana TaxID=1210884 RepID=A0A6P2D4Z4_9BACT|nr:unnamed protein product [Gemmata massiliana]
MPLSRPTTPTTGGRSLSKFPWPRCLLARRRGGSSGSGWRMPFFPRVLEHFIGLGCRTGHRTHVLRGLQSQALKSVPECEPVLAITSEFASQLCGWCALADAPQDQHQLDGRAVRLLERGARVRVKHGPAVAAPVVEHGRAMAVVNGQRIAGTRGNAIPRGAAWRPGTGSTRRGPSTPGSGSPSLDTPRKKGARPERITAPTT